MAFTGTCGPVDDTRAHERESDRVLGETRRMLRDDPDEWYALFDFLAAAWLSEMRQVNGSVLRYNPSGRRFELMELRLMAAQDTFDRLGVSGEARAATAEELLARAASFSASRRWSERAPVSAGELRASVIGLDVRAMEHERPLAAVS